MRSATLRPWLAHAARRAGLPGAFGLAALCGATAVGYFFVVAPASELAATDRLVRTKQIELQAKQAKAGKGARRPAQEQLADFYRRFPLPETIPALLSDMYRAANKEGVVLAVGDYSLLRGEGDQLRQYRMTFPMKGSYPKIRHFISTVLVNAPALALESLQFKRDSAGEGEVDARVVFLLYYMAPP